MSWSVSGPRKWAIRQRWSCVTLQKENGEAGHPHRPDTCTWKNADTCLKH